MSLSMCACVYRRKQRHPENEKESEEKARPHTVGGNITSGYSVMAKFRLSIKV